MPLKKQRSPSTPKGKQGMSLNKPSPPVINTPTTSVSSLGHSSADYFQTPSQTTSFESVPNLQGNMGVGGPTPTQETIKFFERVSLPVPPLKMNRRYTPPRYSIYLSRPSERSPKLLSSIMMKSQTLAHLLRSLHWDDFFTLTNTCHQYKVGIMEDPLLSDAVFSQYIPGYRYVSLYWDSNYTDRQVPCSLMDLHLLVHSLSTPLHLYPSHSLALQSNYQPSQERTVRLRDYCLAYSRFVLLLRFRSLLTPFQDSWLELLPRPAKISPWKSPPNQHRNRVKELVFPAPLSVFEQPATDDDVIVTNGKATAGKKVNRRKMLEQAQDRPLPPRPNSHSPPGDSPSPPLSHIRHRSTAASTPSKQRIKSFVGTQKVARTPPAPLNIPPSMRFYASNWRRKSRVPNNGYDSDLRFGSTALSEDEYSLTPPNKPWGNGPRTEAGSSSGSFTTQNSGSGSSNTIFTAPRNKGPHDLASSTIRTRAPVLRVFVPCSDITPDVLQAVDQEVQLAGLRPYLYVGDVICNLGYVPEGSNDSTGEWLVFNGNAIVPLLPSNVRNPQVAELPSPFYYSDILPYDPIVALTLPPYSLSNGSNSPPNRRRPPQLTLLLSSSPLHSEQPNSVLHVKKYTWLTSIFVSTASCLENKIGEGWAGEWVLEAEGTKECRLCLEGALRGQKIGVEDPQLIWEVIRERSGDGKLWLRLLSQPSSANTLPP